MKLLLLMIAIGIILITILRFKLNAALALILGSLFMGMASGLSFTETTSAINSGFGNLMAGIGLSIGFGVILGQLLSDSGGAQRIANTMVEISGEKYALYALAYTALILSIPVFFDVVFVILIPLGIGMAKRLGKPLPYAIAAMAVGAMAGHTFVPPTPNPLAAAEILNFDLGVMVIVGAICSMIGVPLACKIIFSLLDGGKFWNPEREETGLVEISEDVPDVSNSPSFIASAIPIFLPVILILMGTVMNAVSETVPPIITFLGDKTIALFLGTIAAYFVASKAMTLDEIDTSANKALETLGVVLLITGAGGSFGAVITASGIADFLAATLGSISASPILAVALSAILGFIFRIALGSGTVASITAMTIMSSVAPTLGFHPVWIALACLSGSISGGHVNDSGYWVVTNMSGFTVLGGLKTYSLGGALIGIVGIIIAMIGAVLIPM